MNREGFKISKESVDKIFPKTDINIEGYESPINVVLGKMRFEQENGIYKAIQEQGVYVDKDELIKALKYDREQYEKGYYNGYMAASSGADLYEALQSIIWYDGHSKWLKELCGELEKTKMEVGKYVYGIPDYIEWHTEQHTIWMLLVGAFGDWGTSIRSGWIDDIDGCIKFIQGIIKETGDAE